MSWLSWLLGGDKPHTPRSQLHRLGWPEPSVKETDTYEGVVWPIEPANTAAAASPSVSESPAVAAERERNLKKNRRPDKPAQRGRRQRKRK